MTRIFTDYFKEQLFDNYPVLLPIASVPVFSLQARLQIKATAVAYENGRSPSGSKTFPTTRPRRNVASRNVNYRKLSVNLIVNWFFARDKDDFRKIYGLTVICVKTTEVLRCPSGFFRKEMYIIILMRLRRGQKSFR